MNDGLKNTYDVPVVLIVYKRLEVTKRSFEAIRRLKPAKLYIICDGPKNDEDALKVNEVRNYLDNHIDWECEVHRNYARKNMGLRYRMPSGMKWVFSHEEKAVFVEDDIDPTQDFFWFCREMLNSYETDERVVMISGTNLYPDAACFGEYDLCFSYFSHIWGWATWKRAFELYDVNIRDWPKVRKKGILKKFMTRNTYDFFHIVFDDLQYHWYRTWGYQWNYMLWSKGKLGIVPRYNLVNNIGMGDKEGEHPGDTKERIDYVSNVERREFERPLRYPETVERNVEYDNLYMNNYYTERTGIIKKIKYGIRTLWYEHVYGIIKEMEQDEEYFSDQLENKYILSEEERLLNPGDTYRLISPKEMRKSARRYLKYKKVKRGYKRGSKEV